MAEDLSSFFAGASFVPHALKGNQNPIENRLLVEVDDYHMSDNTMPHTHFEKVWLGPSIANEWNSLSRHLLISQSPNFLSCSTRNDDDEGSNLGFKRNN